MFGGARRRPGRVVCGQIRNIHPEWSSERLRARIRDSAMSGGFVLGGLPRLTFPVERAAEAFAALTSPADVLQVALRYGDR